MREFIVVGRPNSGKTMFTLNFAGYLGCKTVDITFRTYDGLITCRHFTLDEARKELCSIAVHKTRSLQSVVLKMPLGKTTANFKLTDTCGVSEQIHPDEGIRRGMAQTLSILRSADFIIHVIDLSSVTKEFVASLTNIDREVYNYGTVRQNYLVVANKYDLPSAKENLTRLTASFPDANIVPISALYGQGFKEVKAIVARSV